MTNDELPPGVELGMGIAPPNLFARCQQLSDEAAQLAQDLAQDLRYSLAADLLQQGLHTFRGATSAAGLALDKAMASHDMDRIAAELEAARGMKDVPTGRACPCGRGTVVRDGLCVTCDRARSVRDAARQQRTEAAE